jgi:hypothetical protein
MCEPTSRDVLKNFKKRDREREEAIKELEKKLQERDAEKEQMETALRDQNKKLKDKDRERATLELKLRLRIRELREKLQETDRDKKEAGSTIRDQKEFYEKQQQERDAINEEVEGALTGMVNRLQTQLLESERKLRISRTETRFESERAIRRIKGLQNKVRQKDRDRKTVEDNFHCIIKELNDRKKVESDFRARMKKVVAVAVMVVVVCYGVVGFIM